MKTKPFLKHSIGEISTLRKHFHFENCLWPSLLRSRKLITFPGVNSTQGTDPWERVLVYICWKHIFCKEWMSNEQASPYDANAFIKLIGATVVGIYKFTAVCPMELPPLLSLHAFRRNCSCRCGKVSFLPPSPGRATFPALARGGCKLSCLSFIVSVLHARVCKSQAQVWD